MLEWVIIEIDPDNERETDKNNAERHATVRNSSPNPARHTRKIFVTASADDRDQNPGPLALSRWLPLCEAAAQPITSILFAFVFLRWDDAVFDGVGMHGNADPIEDGEPEPEPRARDRGQAGESEDDQRPNGKQKSDAAVTFVNMAEPGDDAEQGRHCVARRALRCLDGALPFPIATIAGLRVFRQTLTTIRTKHCVRGLSGRSVCVFHQSK